MPRQFHLWRVRVVLLLLVGSTTALADSNGASAQDFCNAYSFLARAIMTDRQAGRPMSELMEINGGKTGLPADVLHQLVIQAYEIDRFNSPEYKRNAIIDFENNAHLWCVKRLRNK